MTRCVEFYDKWRADPTWRECSRSGASVSEINNYLDFIDRLEEEHGVDRNIAIKSISEGAARTLRDVRNTHFMLDTSPAEFDAAVISDIVKELKEEQPHLTHKRINDIIDTNRDAIREKEYAARRAETDKHNYFVIIDRLESYGVNRDFAIANLSADTARDIAARGDDVQGVRIIAEVAEILNGPAPTVNADVVNNIINRTGAREEAPKADNKTPPVVLEDRDDENTPYKDISLFGYGVEGERYLDDDVIAAINKYQIPIFDKINEIIRKWLDVEGYT